MADYPEGTAFIGRLRESPSPIEHYFDKDMQELGYASSLGFKRTVTPRVWSEETLKKYQIFHRNGGQLK